MARTSKSVLLPVVAAAVFASLGRMVWQKVQSDKVARETRVVGPIDDKTREWISEVTRTPR